ncbi:MAG: metallophosphoesterase [Chitinophagaceae bacterium]|nr:metallophosphoesterase [Chitinophagaceae bacterium]
MQKNIFKLLLLVCFGLNSCVSSRMEARKYFFFQMTDPQFGFFTANKSFEKETENYTKAIKEANRLKPAFLIVTGDLVNKPFDSAQVNEYINVSRKLDSSISFYNVVGNHDIGNNPAQVDIEKYNALLGKDYYSFTCNTMLGIVLNSLYLTAPQKVTEKALEQEKWLLKTLEEAKNKRYKHIIVFLHHPLFLAQPDEANGYFNIPIDTRKKYLDIFKANGIKYVFAGHYHRNSFGMSKELEMITTGPVGKPLGQDPSGFRIITIKGKRLTHQYYSLDSIPKRVEF